MQNALVSRVVEMKGPFPALPCLALGAGGVNPPSLPPSLTKP